MFDNLKLIAVVLLTLAVCIAVYDVRINVLEKQHIKALAKQESDLKKQCKAAQAVTTEVSHDYQTKLSDLSAAYTKLKRVQPNRCVVPTRSTAGRDAAAGTGQYAGSHGVNTDDLLDFARDAEQYRLQLISCQSFVRKERSIKN